MTDNRNATRVLVMGGGPGGYAAAFKAADLGLDVTLVDLDVNPGGTCLYRGCIPSKALLHVAQIFREAQDAAHWGISFDTPKVDLDRVRAATQEVVGKMTGGLGQLSKARTIQYVQGRASFLESTQVRVHDSAGNAKDIEYDYCILATGSRPATIPHLMIESDRVMNSTDALELPDVPESMLVIGGGYIGLELTTVYAALGSKVTVVDILPHILAGADRDLVKPLENRMNDITEAIHLETHVERLEEAEDGIDVYMSGPEIAEKPQRFSKVLMSVGRTPNSTGIGLENTDVKVDAKGFVEADDQLRTADPHILAIGDLIGQPMLAHKATREGIVAAEVVAGQKAVFDAQCIPAVVFTDPEVAWVGLTESEAKDRGLSITVGKFSWAASGRATTFHRNDGLTKVIVDAETDLVLGVGIVGHGAGELIAEAAFAIEMGATATDLALTIHPHPTLSESLMESAELVHGSSTHLFRPKRKKKPKTAEPVKNVSPAEKRGLRSW